MCKLISKIKSKLFPAKPHWQIIELDSGRIVCCSQCGYEAEEVPIYIPCLTDTLQDIAMGDIDLEDGYFLPCTCPQCGVVLDKKDSYYIPSDWEVEEE